MADKRDKENSSLDLIYTFQLQHKNSGILWREMAFYKRLIRTQVFVLPVPEPQAEELISRKPLSQMTGSPGETVGKVSSLLAMYYGVFVVCALDGALTLMKCEGLC